jgi:hypothetical protein
MFERVSGVFEVLLDVLRSYGLSHAELAEECCHAIGDITVDNSWYDCGAAAGSMEMLVDLLRYYGRSNAVVAKACCWAIGKITSGNVENQVKYGSIAGSMEVLVDVLQAHGNNQDGEDALLFCCWAIEQLCQSNASNQAKLKSLNVIHVLEYEVTVLDNDAAFKRDALKQLR